MMTSIFLDAKINKLSIFKILVAIAVIIPSFSTVYCRSAEANLNISFNFDNKERWVVIICGGSKDPGKHWWEKLMGGLGFIRKASIHVYETFRHLGYDDQHIYFIIDRDIPCNGKDAVVSKEAVRYAIVD